MSVLYDSNDNVLGFYKDLKDYLVGILRDDTDNGDWEDAGEVAELLMDLERWEGSTRLLVMSENNGMGNTIREYKGEDE